VLDVARDARTGQTVLEARALGHLERFAQTAGEPGSDEARLDRLEERRQGRLRRIAPLGRGDEVDLSTV
jgi:hypothetical protein